MLMAAGFALIGVKPLYALSGSLSLITRLDLPGCGNRERRFFIVLLGAKPISHNWSLCAHRHCSVISKISWWYFRSSSARSGPAIKLVAVCDGDGAMLEDRHQRMSVANLYAA